MFYLNLCYAAFDIRNIPDSLHVTHRNALKSHTYKFMILLRVDEASKTLLLFQYLIPLKKSFLIQGAPHHQRMMSWFVELKMELTLEKCHHTNHIQPLRFCSKTLTSKVFFDFYLKTT